VYNEATEMLQLSDNSQPVDHTTSPRSSRGDGGGCFSLLFLSYAYHATVIDAHATMFFPPFLSQIKHFHLVTVSWNIFLGLRGTIGSLFIFVLLGKKTSVDKPLLGCLSKKLNTR